MMDVTAAVALKVAVVLKVAVALMVAVALKVAVDVLLPPRTRVPKMPRKFSMWSQRA